MKNREGDWSFWNKNGVSVRVELKQRNNKKNRRSGMHENKFYQEVNFFYGKILFTLYWTFYFIYSAGEIEVRIRTIQ